MLQALRLRNVDAKAQAAARFRTQHRKTVDGRLCAAAGVQGEQTFTGCTTAVITVPVLRRSVVLVFTSIFSYSAILLYVIVFQHLNSCEIIELSRLL